MRQYLLSVHTLVLGPIRPKNEGKGVKRVWVSSEPLLCVLLEEEVARGAQVPLGHS